jgi:hypothetical protein
MRRATRKHMAIGILGLRLAPRAAGRAGVCPNRVSPRLLLNMLQEASLVSPIRPEVKERLAFVFKHRHLTVKPSENLIELGCESLKRMLECLPAWAILRRFADRVHWLLDTPMDFHQASCRRAAIPHELAFLAVPELEGDGAVEQRGVPQADGHSLSDLRRLSLSIHGGRFRRGATLPAATRPRSPG